MSQIKRKETRNLKEYNKQTEEMLDGLKKDGKEYKFIKHLILKARQTGGYYGANFSDETRQLYETYRKNAIKIS